jgi:hypothetical protein
LGQGSQGLESVHEFGHELGAARVKRDEAVCGEAMEIADERFSEGAERILETPGEADLRQTNGQEMARDMDQPWCPLGLLAHGATKPLNRLQELQRYIGCVARWSGARNQTPLLSWPIWILIYWNTGASQLLQEECCKM